ncbi:MAG: sulfite exporter TauE/SafE family protein [Desulfurivibrionaceae bacterium]|nr:sulfite exporter TauE/SafE family protein [Desulfobulbales bacterium]MDT8336132.1 sulfite exporter TauE/SafE family protein [Desulfurivibrionaceae bacterium]
MEYYLPILVIFFCGAFTQGLTGFGFALVSIPLLVLFIDIKTAVPLCMLSGLAITAFLSLQLRAHLEWRKIRPLLFGCLPGILVGTLFLVRVNEPIFKFSLGAMLIAYALYRLFLVPGPRAVGKVWGWAAGFATGAISAAFSAGGPPTIIYATLTGWKKDEIKSTLSSFFFLGGVATAAAHAVSGLTTAEVVGLSAATLPGVLAGVWAGSLLYGRFKTEGYIKLVLVGLILMGLLMFKSALG